MHAARFAFDSVTSNSHLHTLHIRVTLLFFELSEQFLEQNKLALFFIEDGDKLNSLLHQLHTLKYLAYCIFFLHSILQNFPSPFFTLDGEI